MKNYVRYLQIIPATLLVVACANQKDPVADLGDIRAKANQPQPAPTAPVTPQVIHEPAKPQPPAPPVYLPPKVVPVTEYVTKEVEKIKLVERVTGDSIIITPPPGVTFTEGKAGSFTFKVRCTLPDCTPSLMAEDLPQGATLTPEGTSERGTSVYKLTWTPRLGLTDPSAGAAGFQSRFKASAKAKDPELNKALQGIVGEEETVSIMVLRSPIEVKEVRFNGLPKEIQAGKEADFSISVRITGIDSQGAIKPTLTITDDESIQTPGGPVEIAGGLFVQGPRIGNFDSRSGLWVFDKLKFNTKRFLRPSDLNSDTASAGLGAQVCAGGPCADIVTTKVNIKYPRETPPAPAVVAPAAAKAAPAAKAATTETKAPAQQKAEKAPAAAAKKEPKTTTDKPATQRAQNVGQK